MHISILNPTVQNMSVCHQLLNQNSLDDYLCHRFQNPHFQEVYHRRGATVIENVTTNILDSLRIMPGTVLAVNNLVFGKTLNGEIRYITDGNAFIPTYDVVRKTSGSRFLYLFYTPNASIEQLTSWLYSIASDIILHKPAVSLFRSDLDIRYNPLLDIKAQIIVDTALQELSIPELRIRCPLYLISQYPIKARSLLSNIVGVNDLMRQAVSILVEESEYGMNYKIGRGV